MKSLPPHILRKRPVGWWICTHSTFRQFTPGAAYPCVQSGFSLLVRNTWCEAEVIPDTQRACRIFPQMAPGWSPYWEETEGRFCYDPAELDFAYLAPFQAHEYVRILDLVAPGHLRELHRDEHLATVGPVWRNPEPGPLIRIKNMITAKTAA